MSDKELPPGVSGLILGGGYPEEHREELSANQAMRDAVREAVRGGMPVYAECGGFMYLGESIEKDGQTYQMAGALPGHSHMTDKLVRFGYKMCIRDRISFRRSMTDAIWAKKWRPPDLLTGTAKCFCCGPESEPRVSKRCV